MNGASPGREEMTRSCGIGVLSYGIEPGPSRGRGSDVVGRGVSRGSRIGRGRGKSRLGTRAGEGLGCKRPMVLDSLSLLEINDMPSGLPLEVPLHTKRQRKWSPSQNMVHQASSETPVHTTPTSPTQSVEVMVEVEHFDNHEAVTGNEAFPPSPALFVECDTASGTGTPVQSDKGTPQVVNERETPLMSRKLPPPRRRLQDQEIETLLGSESESEEENVVSTAHQEILLLSRVCKAALDTPLDGDADTIEPADTSAEEIMSSTSVPEEIMSTRSENVMEPYNFFDFQWKSFPDPPIPPNSRRETFSVSNVGPTFLFENPYEVFSSIWDPQIMEHIAHETNRYAQQVAQRRMDKNDLYPKSRISDWRDITADDVWIYFALVLAMGIVVKTRIEEYWNTDADIFETPGFRVHMSLRKFQAISACIHFNNNEDMCALNLSASEAELFKIQPVLDHLNRKFQLLYTLRQNIALDESLLMWKGWLHISQLIPNKAATIGIKTYEICESHTGYLWRFEVHAHKSTSLSQQGNNYNPLEAPTPAIVLRLVHSLEHKGYTLWMDNFYQSPALARKLKSLGFDCVGTLRTDRQFVPQELTKLKKAEMSPGQITGCTSGDVDLLVWRDKNRVATISTYHGNATTLVDGELKPIVIADYNIMMGGVDKKDQLLSMYPIERKRTKIWYKKFFRRLLNVSALNAHIILKQSPRMASPSFATQRVFRATLVKSILEKHSNSVSHSVPPTPQNKYNIRIHHLAEYGFLPGDSSVRTQHTERKRRQCTVCKKRVHLFCEGCQKPFCLNPCFVTYHS